MNTQTLLRPHATWPCLRRRRRPAQRGFSLVEIAVVLIIVGFALGTGIAIFQSRIEQAQIETTRTRAEAIRTALVAYVARTYRMPCPAAPGIVFGAANYGVEMVAGGCIAGNGLVNNVGAAGPTGASRGTVPCTTLGLTDDACTDAWGSRFTYFVTNSAVLLTQANVSGMQGNLTVHRITPPAAATPVTGLAPTGNQINACSATAGDNGCNLAGVAVIISHGANQAGGYIPASATALPTAGVASAYEVANTDNNLQFVQNEYVKTGANSFDDIVVAVPARDVLSTLSQNNTLKDPVVLMNERFESIAIALIQAGLTGTSGSKMLDLATGTGAVVPYNHAGVVPAINFGGCVTPTDSRPLPSSATVAALNGIDTDVWGQSIQYKEVVTGAFNASEACVTPFVLVSYGRDGVTGGATGGADDLVYPVTMGKINTIVLQKSSGW